MFKYAIKQVALFGIHHGASDQELAEYQPILEQIRQIPSETIVKWNILKLSGMYVKFIIFVMKANAMAPMNSFVFCYVICVPQVHNTL